METSLSAVDGTVEASTPAVSWAAIFAGTAAAVAATLILVALGSGLGLASGSPWANAGATAATLSTLAAIWLIVVQWIASGVGGYLTGRLRTRWVGTHTHEVFFRDTANGLLSWAVASVAGAVIVTSAAAFVASGTSAVATGASSGVAAGATQTARPGALEAGPSAYLLDRLFRTDRPGAAGSDADAKAQTAIIIANGVAVGDVSAPDKTYVAQLVSARTGLTPEDATRRVDTAIDQAKAAEFKARQVADAARRAAATLSIFTALALLIGAFIACSAAALGGQQRDQH